MRLTRFGGPSHSPIEHVRFSAGSHKLVGWISEVEPPRMLLYFANRSVGVVGEPFLVSGGELVVVVEASFE